MESVMLAYGGYNEGGRDILFAVLSRRGDRDKIPLTLMHASSILFRSHVNPLGEVRIFTLSRPS
ncbi:MAG: hypothetical protein ACOWYE_08320 [Desulfatiglandales bacterium]